MNASTQVQAKLDAVFRLADGQPYVPPASTQQPALSRPSEPVSDSPQLLRAALEYAKCGWQVIPLHSPNGKGCSCGLAECESPGKHPRTRNGLKDASSDPATIRQWWKRCPDANVGIATGPESGVFVLDIDGAKGENSLIELARQGFSLPDTYVVQTGGGGSHFYFTWPTGLDIRNSASKLGPGLDVRGAGGYVVAPPSLHKSGEQYELLESAIPAVEAPEWLLTRIQEAKTQPAPASASAPATVEAPARLPKGKGDPAKLSLAGSLLRKGTPLAVVEAAVIALDKTREHERGEADCKRKVREWAKRYSQGQPLAEANHASMGPDLIRLSDVAARNVDWLWEPFIPAGMITMLSGDPGSGKSFIALSLCADLSRGRLRDGRTIAPANSIYLSIENPIAQSIRPRLDSLGADPQYIYMAL
jgi:hypothetical protein